MLLIVDEAQNLGANLLEELRLLSNLNKDKAPILQIILSGQPDLRQLLQRKDLTQFAQRVMVDYSLEPFKEEDSLGYIAHRLRVAGREEPIFTHHATRMIHRLTGGIPRLINQLCDTALTYGFAEEAPFLSTKIVAQAAKDRSKGGILPLTDTDALTAMTSEQDAAEQAQLATFASRTASTPSLGDRSAKTVQATTAARPPSHDAGKPTNVAWRSRKSGCIKMRCNSFPRRSGCGSDIQGHGASRHLPEIPRPVRGRRHRISKSPAGSARHFRGHHPSAIPTRAHTGILGTHRRHT